MADRWSHFHNHSYNPMEASICKGHFGIWGFFFSSVEDFRGHRERCKFCGGITKGAQSELSNRWLCGEETHFLLLSCDGTERVIPPVKINSQFIDLRTELMVLISWKLNLVHLHQQWAVFLESDWVSLNHFQSFDLVESASSQIGSQTGRYRTSFFFFFSHLTLRSSSSYP